MTIKDEGVGLVVVGGLKGRRLEQWARNTTGVFGKEKICWGMCGLMEVGRERQRDSGLRGGGSFYRPSPRRRQRELAVMAEIRSEGMRNLIH